MFCMGNNQQENLREDSSAKKIENYIFKYEDLLGKGNFGSAYSGYDVNTGKQVAIKVIKMSSIKSKVSQKLLENEIQILRNLKNHPNILKCCDVFTSVNNCYIITQLCDHDLQKDLTTKGKFRQHEIKEVIYGIYKGLEQLARNSIVHRDIKISNIFLSKTGIPKIADFGFAIKATKPFKDLNIGSPLYMSPEGLLYNQYGPKTDVWSFGVLIYEILNGETPLERCTTDQQLKTQILLPPRFINSISPELKQVIQACLTVDQFKRPNIYQLSNFAYFQKLFTQIQTRPFSLKQSSHQSTNCSEDVYTQANNPYFYTKELTYENSVSLLHYCRLLHKINKKCIKSSKLSQFLINLSFSLSKASISSNNTFNEQLNKLKQVLQEYVNKFMLEHEDMHIFVSPRQVLGEIQSMIKNPRLKPYSHIIEVLGSETKILTYSLEHQSPEIFTKNSEAKSTIDSNKLGL